MEFSITHLSGDSELLKILQYHQGMRQSGTKVYYHV